MKHKVSTRITSVILAVVMLLTAMPIGLSAGATDDINDNVFLDALAYTGYKLSALKSDGKFLTQPGASISGQSGYRSAIPYGAGNTGLETTGGKPDISSFNSGGLVCASYVSYVYFNYLPNVAKIDTSTLTRPSNYKTVGGWYGLISSWKTNGSTLMPVINNVSGDKNRVSFNGKTVPVGSIVFFKGSDGTLEHVALYAGYKNGYHFVTHVGGDEGPCFSTIEYMQKDGNALTVAAVLTPPDAAYPSEDKGVITIRKYRTETTIGLAGVTFMVTFPDGHAERWETEADGTYTKDKLPLGKYTIKEVATKAGYKLDAQEETFTLKADAPTYTYTAYNDVLVGSVSLVKRDKSDTSKTLAGAVFTLSGKSTVDTIVNKTSAATGSDGKVTFSNVPYGTYTVHESTVPAGYKAVADFSVTVDGSNLNRTYNVDDPLILGKITIKKSSATSSKALTGAKFFAVKIGETSPRYFSDKGDGTYTLSSLKVGTYNVYEQTAPTGYKLPTSGTQYTTTYGGATVVGYKVGSGTVSATSTDIQISVSNSRKTGKVTLTKKNENGTALAGAKFVIIGNTIDNVSFTALIPWNEETKTYTKTEVPYGTYTITESVTPAGHTGSFSQTVTIDDSHQTITLSAVNTTKKGSISIHKTDDDDAPLAGAVFTVTGTTIDGDSKTFTLGPTGADGNAKLTNVPYGTYTVKETTFPSGYRARKNGTKEVVIDDDNVDISYTVVNTKKTGNFYIKKTDFATGDPLAGAVFEATNLSTGERFTREGRYDANGVLHSDEYYVPTDSTYETKAGGTWRFMNLPYGEYLVVEVKAPTNYTAGSSWRVVVDASTSGASAATAATFVNYEKTGGIYIHKTDIHGTALAGAVFTATNNSTSEVTTFSPTNSKGFTSVVGLPYGTYTVKETTFPKNYTSTGTNSWTVTISDGNATASANPTASSHRTNELFVQNQLKTGAIAIKKTDEDGNPLANVYFGIYTDLACTSRVSGIKTNSAGVAIYGKNSDGSFYLEHGKKYYIREISPASDLYLKDTTVYPVTVVHSTTTYANGGEAVINYKKRFRVEFDKVDEQTGKVAAGDASLAAAEYGLYAADGTLLKKYTTNANGSFETDVYDCQAAYIQEIKAPVGYAIDLTLQSIQVAVNETEQNISSMQYQYRQLDSEIMALEADKKYQTQSEQIDTTAQQTAKQNEQQQLLNNIDTATAALKEYEEKVLVLKDKKAAILAGSY